MLRNFEYVLMDEYDQYEGGGGGGSSTITLTLHRNELIRTEFDVNDNFSRFPQDGRCTYTSEFLTALKEKLDELLNDDVSITNSNKTFTDNVILELNTSLSISEVNSILSTEFQMQWIEIERFKAYFDIKLQVII